MIAGLTQKELAVASGCRRPTISALENGQQTPRPQTAHSIAAVLGYPAEKVFGPNDAGQAGNLAGSRIADDGGDHDSG